MTHSGGGCKNTWTNSFITSITWKRGISECYRKEHCAPMCAGVVGSSPPTSNTSIAASAFLSYVHLYLSCCNQDSLINLNLILFVCNGNLNN